jgi:hypothetical protein
MMNKRIESVLHVTLLGWLLGLLIGELAIPLYLIREFTDWKMPWIFKGQWPPGDIGYFNLQERSLNMAPLSEDDVPYAPLDRVRDMANDLVETFSGWIIGNLMQKGLILWLIIH